MNSNRNNKGFTLIELLGTIVVLGVIASISIYSVINIIGSIKEKSYKVTINNIQKEANNYVMEENSATKWIVQNGTNSEYQCVSVQNLIDAGYFKSDVLEANVSNDRKVRASDNIFLLRDRTTKSITKSILLVNANLMPLCNSYSPIGEIVFISDDAWSIEKNIGIQYNIYNVDDIFKYGYSYDYRVNNSVVNTDSGKFSSNNEEESLNVKNNGILDAQIIMNGFTYVSNTLHVTKIDNIPPTGDITATNNVANKQTVDLTMEDEEPGSGVDKYYFGTKDPKKSEVEWISTDNSTKSKAVDASGTYYLGIKDAVGNMTVISKDFYKTTLNISNASVEPTEIITMNGNSFDVEDIKVKEDKYYRFINWYQNYLYTGKPINEYIPTNDSILYGKTQRNELVAGTVTINGTVMYGNTLTAEITTDTYPKADEYKYQWYISDTKKITDGTAIEGATKKTLELRENEFNKYIYVIVTAIKDNYWKYPESGVTFGKVTDSKVAKRPLMVTSNTASKEYDGTPLTDYSCIADTPTANSGLIDKHSVRCIMPPHSSITDVGNVDNNIATVNVLNDKAVSGYEQYYDITKKAGKLSITYKSVTIPVAEVYCKNNLSYTGSVQTLTNDAGEGYIFSSNTGINAKEYYINATLKNNYMWSDGTRLTKQLICKINKAIPELTLSPLEVSMEEESTVDLTYTYNGDGNLSIETTNSNVASSRLGNSNKVVVTSKTIGDVNVTLKATGGTNYEDSEISASVKVTEKPKYYVNIVYSVNDSFDSPASIQEKSDNKKHEWSIDSNRYVFDKDENTTYRTRIKFGETIKNDGLINYNNSDFVKITRDGYSVISDDEWVCLSNNCNHTTYDQENNEYTSDDFCDASKGDCEVVLGVNWEKVSYKINYFVGRKNVESKSCTYNESCTLDSFSSLSTPFPNNAYGWNFHGWSTVSDSYDLAYKDGQTFEYSMTEDLNLYAIGKRNVEFYSGEAPTTAKTSPTQYWASACNGCRNEIVIPQNIEISGWSFLGYKNDTTASSDVNYNAASIGSSIKLGLTDSNKYTSVYSRELTINYNNNGGTGTIPSDVQNQYYNSGYPVNNKNSNANLSTVNFTLNSGDKFSKTGYKLSKWAEIKPNGNQYDPGTNYSVTPVFGSIVSITMYAIWKDNTAPVVTFNINALKAYDEVTDPNDNTKTIKQLNDNKTLVQYNGSFWTRNANITLTVTDDTQVDIVKYVLVKGKSLANNINNYPGSYTWTNYSGNTIYYNSAYGTYDGTYYLNVYTCDVYDNCIISSTKLKLDTVAPTIDCNKKNAALYQYIRGYNEKNGNEYNCSYLPSEIKNNRSTYFLDWSSVFPADDWDHSRLKEHIRYKYDTFSETMMLNNGNSDACSVYSYHFNCQSHFTATRYVFNTEYGSSGFLDRFFEDVIIDDSGENNTAVGQNGVSPSYRCECVYGWCKKEYTITAYDQAGNSSSKTFTYYIMFDANNSLEEVKKKLQDICKQNGVIK